MPAVTGDMESRTKVLLVYHSQNITMTLLTVLLFCA